MALENDLVMFGRRLNHLETPSNYIRIGTFIVYENAAGVEVDRVFEFETTEDGRNPSHTHKVQFKEESLRPISGRFIKGKVGWFEENQQRIETAILVVPRMFVNFGSGSIPAVPRGGEQVLLLLVSGLIFAIPMMDSKKVEE